MTTVGGRIKYYRLLNGLKQKDIYDKIGIDKSTYIHYESRSTISFNLEICKKICEALGIDPVLVYDDYMAFIVSDYGTTIRVFRKIQKLTHKKFGTLIGMHPKISARWEKRKSIPSRASYIRMIELFMKYEH